MAVLLNGNNHTTRTGNDVVRYISWHWKQLGYPPSIRAIGKAVGISSTSTMQQVLKDLERQGKITRDPYHRSVKVVNGKSPEVCEHDWRTQGPVGEIVKVICVACFRETEFEFHPDPEQPSTWLRFMGQGQ
jgi:SOS-response transcriptional repressor LexA